MSESADVNCRGFYLFLVFRVSLCVSDSVKVLPVFLLAFIAQNHATWGAHSLPLPSIQECRKWEQIIQFANRIAILDMTNWAQTVYFKTRHRLFVLKSRTLWKLKTLKLTQPNTCGPGEAFLLLLWVEWMNHESEHGPYTHSIYNPNWVWVPTPRCLRWAAWSLGWPQAHRVAEAYLVFFVSCLYGSGAGLQVCTAMPNSR